jgi:ComF family protein
MFVRAVSFCVYEGAIRKALHALKYDGMVPASKQLGKLLGKALHEFAAESGPNLPAEMLIVPVPLYRGRKSERGFNQAQALAVEAMRHIAHTRPEWKLRLAENGLTRRLATKSQAGLTPRQRRQNLRGVFVVSDEESIRGRHILLVDDIYTTGATARACSKVLMESGAASVYVATVARAQRRVPQQVINRSKYLRPSISGDQREYEHHLESSNSYTVH